MKFFKFRHMAAAACALTFAFGSAEQSEATVCYNFDSGFFATMEATPIGSLFVRVEAETINVYTGMTGSSGVLLRWAEDDTGVKFTAAGAGHKWFIGNGANWGIISGGLCSFLGYVAG